MQAIKEEMFFPKTRSALSRRDLLIYEEQLCADLRSFIGFESHALYFPVEDELKAYTYVPEEKKLLLPLRIKDSLLGVLLLKEVRAEEENFALLPSLVRLCLEKIHLCKRERLDERSGLLRPCFFMEKLKKEVQAINAYFQTAMRHDMRKQENEFPLSGMSGFSSAVSFMQEEQEHALPMARQSSIGLMVLPVLGLNAVRSAMGYSAGEQIGRASCRERV